MASKLLTSMMLISIMMTCVSALPSPHHHHFRIGLPLITTTTTSTISASPSYFTPDNYNAASPLSAPSPSVSMSPDVTPLLPSPGPDSALSPSDNSIPTIPSNPSPPNPDSILAPQPLMASSPTGLMGDSSAVDLRVSGSVLVALLAALWLVQI